MKMDPLIILLISSLFSIINYLFWARIKRVEKDTSENSLNLAEMQQNYISKFEEIKDALNLTEKNIIEKIHLLEKNIIENYVSKKEYNYYNEEK
jgi:hypothetical protein